MSQRVAPSAKAGIAALLACAAFWSLSGLLIKLLKQSGVDGVTIACSRSLIGGLVFLPFALPQHKSLRNVHPGWIAAGVVLFTLMTTTYVISNTLTGAANAIILQCTSPLWVFMLSPFLLGETARRREALVLLLSMAGIGVIFFGNPSGELPGLTIALFSGVWYGALTVTLRRLRPVAPLVVTCVNTLGSGLILLPLLVWDANGVPQRTAYQLALLLIMALVQFSAPYALFSWALQRVDAPKASLIVLLETVLNPLWAYVGVGEVPPPATIVGGAMILASVIGLLAVSVRSQPSFGQEAAP
ncbi:MAG: EamA family transporter [Phycisphaerales bacterium]|nr:EamA family transporter [Phycisphaerales bacterium]